MDRREFLKISGLVGVGIVIAPHMVMANLNSKHLEIYYKVRNNTERMLVGYEHERLGEQKFDGEKLYNILYYLQDKPNVTVHGMDYPIQTLPRVINGEVILHNLCTSTHATRNLKKGIVNYIDETPNGVVGIYTCTNQYSRIAKGNKTICY